MPGLRVTPAAQEVFAMWLTEREQRLRAPEAATPAFESPLAQYRSLMPSLARIFHLRRQMEGDWEGDAIAQDRAELAIDWCDFLERHARCCNRRGATRCTSVAGQHAPAPERR